MVTVVRIASSVLVVVFLTISAIPWTADASSSASSAAELELVSRGAISIFEDGDFTAENGVVSGDGTSGDPYIIEGWEIAFNNSGTCITVVETSKYFVIRDVRLVGAKTAVRLTMLTHARVTGAVIENCTVGISASYTDLSRVDNNLIANCSIGISLRYCDAFKVRDITYLDNDVDLRVTALPWIETRQADLLLALIGLGLGAFVVLLLYMRFKDSRPPDERP
jgi:hypothetical protein